MMLKFKFDKQVLSLGMVVDIYLVWLLCSMDAGSSNSMEEQTSSCIYIERSMIDFNFQHSSPVDIQKAERSTYLEI